MNGEQFNPEVGGNVPIESLPERLGFVETDEMRQTKLLLLDAFAAGREAEVRSLAISYHVMGEELVNEKIGDDFPKAQIGLLINAALLKRQQGRIEDYLDELEDAQDYALGMDYLDINNHIAKELSRDKYSEVERLRHATSSWEVARTLYNLGEDYGFDHQTCFEISKMPFEEAFETAYSYVTQAGLDADEVLAKFIEPKKPE